MKLRTLVVAILLINIINLYAQEHGSILYRAKNVHAGNLIRLTFANNGRMGGEKGDQSTVFSGEWPIGSGKVQMGNASAYVMSELRIPKTGDTTATGQYEFVNPVIFCQGWDPDLFSHDTKGRFQGFEPLPGYLNMTQKEKDPSAAVAMSHQPFTWPAYWPDKMEDKTEPGWRAHWNGFFGKDQMNADEESYFVMDDYQYDKKQKGLSLPKPVSSQPDRNGLGLSLQVRGLQWSNPDAEDCIFWLYRIGNMGELYLDKTVFGSNIGASSGNLLSGGGSDNSDDNAQFYRQKSLAVNFDNDNLGVGGYTPVPWVGFAFLESPGNASDGIDNDGDGNDISKPGGGTGKLITEDDFVKVYMPGDSVVLIDYNNEKFTRHVIPMPAEGIKINRFGKEYTMKAGAPLIEIPRNGIDDNLNGLIDESDGSVTQDSVSFYLYIRSEFNDKDYRSINYITGEGLENKMIDESRNDGIDNDGDWDPQFDDVGVDGKPGTGDLGEGDGKPTPGYGDLPGESNVDLTDVDESDQIGLTSFKFYRYGALTYSNDDQMWDYSRPGYFDNKTTEVADYDYVFSSGYFPLRPGQKEFFSVAMIYGEDEYDILNNKDVVQKIYNSNYNFAIAPIKPKVKVVAGNKQVTLYWDDKAESSYDRFLREYDFEGYKIYKSTHYTFQDAGTITDGNGYDRFKKPIAIFDKIDGVYGFFPDDMGKGVQFNLGNETGLVHSFVDRNVMNGIKYYYAVTAYDKGDLSKNIGPTETTIFLNVDPSGKVTLSDNVVVATPQASALGYEAPKFDVTPRLQGGGISTGTVGVNILNPAAFTSTDDYEIQFLDISMDKVDNDGDGLIDAKDKKELMPLETSGMILKNLTKDEVIDTVMFKKYDPVTKSLLKNMFDDNDGDPNTVTAVIGNLQVYVKNPEPSILNDSTKGIIKGVQWSKSLGDSGNYTINFDKFVMGGSFQEGTPYPRQYKIVFHNAITDTGKSILLPAKSGKGGLKLKAAPCNFSVYDKQSGQKVPFAFIDATVNSSITQAGYFSAKDFIVLYETLSNDSTLITYKVQNNADEDSVFIKKHGRSLGEGDTLSLYPDFPYTGQTKFVFRIKGQSVNQEVAKTQMSNIKVVPNPYTATALWEPHNPYTSGRGPRLMQFTHLPEKCTIRIFAVDGTLVRTLVHDSGMNDGSESWDLMTKDNMEVAYGVYVYHVDAPGVGQHIGRLLIIK